MTLSQERIEAAIALAEAVTHRGLRTGDSDRTLKERYMDATVRELCDVYVEKDAARGAGAPSTQKFGANLMTYKLRVEYDVLDSMWKWSLIDADSLTHPLPGEFYGFAATRTAALYAARSVAEILLGVKL